MSITEIIELVILAVAIVTVVIYCFVKGIKNHWFKQIKDAIKIAVREAEEKFPKGHGEEKKKYVLEQIKLKGKELQIPVSLLYGLINSFIDQIIDNYNVIVKKK